MPYRIRSATLTGFFEVACAAGLNPYAQLQAVGLDAACLQQQDQKIPARAVAQLLENAAQASGWDDFGMRMVVHRTLALLGPLALALRNAPTLRAALALLKRNHRMHHEGLLMFMEEHGELATLREEHMVGEAVPMQQVSQVSMGMLFRILQTLQGPAWRPHHICFSQAPPRDRSHFTRVFGMPVQFGSSVDGIVCERRDLDRPLPQADALMAQHADRYLASLSELAHATLPDKVRRMVWVLLPQGQCSVQRVATQLGMERSTLFRQLARYGVTFSALVDAIRAEQVPRHLAIHERSLTEITQLLGFSSLANFSRWFKQRFGCSPSQWRRERAGTVGQRHVGFNF